MESTMLRFSALRRSGAYDASIGSWSDAVPDAATSRSIGILEKNAALRRELHRAERHGQPVGGGEKGASATPGAIDDRGRRSLVCRTWMQIAVGLENRRQVE
jgi:hypothetical protein